MSIDAIESGPKKRPALSIPFLVTAVTIGGICYLVGPWIMTQYFYQQEQSIAAELYSGKFKPSVRPSTQDSGGGDASPGAERGARGGGGGGGFDPEATFARRDEDKNGKLEGDEISERMKGRLKELDKDEDGAISKEEFLAGMQNGGGGGGRGARPASEESSPESVSLSNLSNVNSSTPDSEKK